jgi:hypothetical protein
VRGVPTYAQVEYRDVYPNVDLRYYGTEGNLEYDFVLAPGADPSAIRFGIEGAGDLRIDPAGNLVMSTGSGEIVQRAPVVYQQNHGVRKRVTGRFTLLDGQVGFDLGRYDRTKALVIDPAIAYSTYLGGSAFDDNWGIAVDGAGSAYVAGETASLDFPTTPGALQPASGSQRDGFVTKLNAAGTAIMYSTYLGGAGDDTGTGIAVDGAGNAFVAGLSTSSNFPTTPGAFQTVNGGSFDAFVTKLDPSGGSLLYATYVGGNSAEQGGRLAVDSSGNAYLQGFTASTNFPTSAGAFQTTFGGGTHDTFVTKLNPSGSALVYSTYLGGGDHDFGVGVGVDNGGNAYVTGTTASSNFPTTAAAFQTSPPGSENAFVSKINATGSGLEYSTYLGGDNIDFGNAIAVDAVGSAYAVGETASANFPITPGGFQTALAGFDTDMYVTKLNASGSGLEYSTYLGGTGQEHGQGIVVDAAGRAYTTGSSGSSNFPTTAGALRASLSGPNDAFVTKLNASGTGLEYSTYVGGSATDGSSAIVVDGVGDPYVAGGSRSTDFPTTLGAFATTSSGDADGFVTKLDLNATTGTLAGTVRDPNGQAVPGSLVRACVSPGSPDPGCVNGLATTDAAGNYAFQLSPGTYKAAASFGALRGTDVTVTIVAGQTRTQDFTLPVSTVSGTVLDGSNQPFPEGEAGLSVCSPPDSGPNCPDAQVVFADALGNYAIRLAPGTYNLAGFSEGFGSVGPSTSLTTAAGQTVQCNVHMPGAPVCGSDADGVPDAVEAGAPNGGDGNSDGIPDAQQANVTSLPNAVNGQYATLASPAGTTLANVSAVDPATLPPPPSGAQLPAGVFSFEVRGVPSGGAATVDVFLSLPPNTSIDSYFKFQNNTWQQFGGATIAGNHVTLALVDGGAGDGDGVANGVIVDPGAPGDLPPPVPKSKDDCKNGGWKNFVDDQGRPFKNQGDCVSFVSTKGKNKAKG